MKGSNHSLLKCLLSTLIILPIISHSSASLSTNSRWIVSPSGDRVKLRCVNWPGHLSVMIPEGLSKQSVKIIAEQLNDMGFNCVRLTWAVEMYTLKQNKNLTVEQSLDAWNLTDAKEGIKTYNPSYLNLTIADAQKAVIDELGANNLMVVLDNHVSKPVWCCHNDDGNGFFGDQFFDPQEWLKALGIVANRYKDNPTVVGMSLRNELRGSRQSESTWYTYMQQGAEVIHKESPEFLVIVSGFNFDTFLNFLKQKAFNVSFQNKLVFESHAYAFGQPLDKWTYQTNEYCGNETKKFFDQSGFLTVGDAKGNKYPLFLSEFGVNLKDNSDLESYYLSCLLATMAGMDLDWALWSLQGSYMLREETLDLEEVYGILNKDWHSVRSTDMLRKLQLIQQINIDPKSSHQIYYKMFHPQTGMCVQADKDNYIYAAECRRWARWSHEGDGTPIKLSDGRCLVAVGDGQEVTVSNNCSAKQAQWSSVSGSKLHIATTDEQGNSLCLEWDHANATEIMTRKCLCLDGNNNDLPHCEDNPMRQWFKFVPFNTKH